MKPFVASKKNDKSTPLYIQLYRHIRSDILSGNIKTGEKLPSLRKLAELNEISITTAEQAYNQLLTEGYITSRPQSGYYVSKIDAFSDVQGDSDHDIFELTTQSFDNSRYLYDLSAFDFQKWKKCTSRVFNEYPHLLLFESDVQGEQALRYEISKYVYSSRGVIADLSQVVIGAGTQQLTTHLCHILRHMNIGFVCTEDPGYVPIQKIFHDNDFGINKIPVSSDGIRIDMLPVNIASAVYVSPANQFPTGSVMSIASRYKLLAWANQNNSIILEDDYDSELRYFGKPIPALQGLDKNHRVVYFGSFSSTLFPAIKVSYMILPPNMAEIFASIKANYTQTCSKTEQLTLALFMENGYYYTNIRRLRSLYAQKLQLAISSFAKYGMGFIDAKNTKSGINIILDVKSEKSAEMLCQEAESLRLYVATLNQNSETEQKNRQLIFYYNQIPIDLLEDSIKSLTKLWAS